MKINLVKHPEFGEVRTLLIEKEPWFCAIDICQVLGYKNELDAIKKHCREKGVAKRDLLTSGGKQEINFISEGNLYRLILRSRMPAAEKFESWVCDDVLPSIRKNGFYIHPDFMDQKSLNKLKKQLSESLENYLTSEDITKTAKRFGLDRWYINSIISGSHKNNAVMQELQRRAMLNKNNELNAYHPDRLHEVVNKLRS